MAATLVNLVYFFEITSYCPVRSFANELLRWLRHFYFLLQLKFDVVCLRGGFIHWRFIQEVEVVGGHRIFVFFNGRPTHPWLPLLYALYHGILPDERFLSIDGPSGHRSILVEKF